MKIIFLGDSLVYGYTMQRSACWTVEIAERISATVLNRGINGETTGGMLARFQHDVVDEAPQVVFLLGGVNDCIMDVPQGVIRSNISSMVFQAVSRMIIPIIGIHIPILPEMASRNWPARIDFRAVSERVARYRQWIRDFSEDFDVSVIDFHLLFEEKKKALQGTLDSLYIDGLHPTNTGYGYMTDHWVRSLKKILGSDSSTA